MEKRISLYKKTDTLIEKVWKVLVNVANAEKTISFYRLLIKVGLSPHNRQTLMNLIVEVGEIEFENNRPLLNCLVVDNDGQPTNGFFMWLGNLPDKSRWTMSQQELFEYHKECCHTFWRDEEHFKAFKSEKLSLAVASRQ